MAVILQVQFSTDLEDTQAFYWLLKKLPSKTQVQNIVHDHPCQKQNPNDFTKATVKFVVEKQKEHHK
jgi:hypothetical protein